MGVKFRDYYEILGVNRKATDSEIKTAYRKLARKYHPDLHTGKDKEKAEAKFKELNEANEVLSDPEKRKKFDRLGANWRQGMDFTPPPGFEGARFNFSDMGGGAGGDFSDFFSAIFGGGMGPGYGSRRTAGRSTGRDAYSWSQKGSDLETDLKLSLEDAHKGGKHSFQLNFQEICAACGGTGRSGSAPCFSCRGRGFSHKPKQIEVNIPPGTRKGTRLRLKGQGQPGTGGGPRGDLFLTVHFFPHAFFSLDGYDITLELPLYPWEALFGTRIDVPTLDGTVTLKVPPESQNGRKLRFKEKGFQKKGGGRGDQYVKLKIINPFKIGEKEKKLFKKLSEFQYDDPREQLFSGRKG